MTDISIVLPVHNGGATLAAQLEALEHTIGDHRAEVIVADNGSTDETADIARSYGERLSIQVVDASHARGANVARNRGVAAARGQHLLFCDADDEVDPLWLTAMAAAFGRGHELVAGPIDYRRLNPSEVRAWRGANAAGVEPMLGFLKGAHASNLGVSRRLFDALGGFDEAFAYGGDDVEFVWRAQLAGHQLTELPDAVVHYRLRPSLRDLWRQAVSYGAAEAHLFTRFRDHGLRRRPAWAVLGELWWLATRMPFALPRGRRGAWLRRLGQQVGRFQGARRHRTWWW